MGQEKHIPREGDQRSTLKIVLNELNEVLESQHYKTQTVDPDLESTIKYTPKIAAWNQEIATLDGNLNKNKNQILTCEGNMKGRRMTDGRIQARLAVLLKQLNHKKETYEAQIRSIKTDKESFYLDTRVKAAYESAEAYNMVKEAKEDEELEILMEEYGSDIDDFIEREKEIRSGTSKPNKQNGQSVTISPSITTIENTTKSPKRCPRTPNSNKDIKDNSKSNDADQDSNSSDASDADDAAYEPEEHEFMCGSKLVNKFMKLTTGTTVGVNILPGFDRSSHASLSRDLTEQAKISSSDLAINDIKA